MNMFPDRDAEEPPGEVLNDVQEEPPGVIPQTAPVILKIPFTLVSETFPIAERRYFFIRRYYPGVDAEHWNHWRWQSANSISKKAELERLFCLSPAESKALEKAGRRLPLRITPYYASLMNSLDPEDPLRRTVIPRQGETSHTLEDLGVSGDPLHEEEDSVCPNLVHRYPDRVLYLAANACAVNCRYCTRSRVVGKTKDRQDLARAIFHERERQKAFAYIREHREIRDVLISGGDPLTLSDAALEEILKELRSISHVEMIRIGTKVPAVLPQRITRGLVDLLKKYHPLYISIHATHPAECTLEMKEACERLADGGIPLGSQTVLLKGINDDPEILGNLFKKLLSYRVRPYYLYQCDPVEGAEQFRTPVEKGVEIIDALQGYMSGYGIPTFVVDAPGGGGKIPVFSRRLLRREGNFLVLKNYRGNEYKYPDRKTRVERITQDGKRVGV